MRWRASKTSFSLGGHKRAKDEARGSGEGDGRHFQGEWIGSERSDEVNDYGGLIRSLLMGQGIAQEATTLEVAHDKLYNKKQLEAVKLRISPTRQTVPRLFSPQ